LTKLNRYPQAIEYYQRALHDSPEDASLHSDIADLLVLTGETPKAIDHFQTAIQLKPDSFEAHFKLAKALALADRSEEAISNSQKAIALAHSNGSHDVAEKIEEWLTHYQ